MKQVKETTEFHGRAYKLALVMLDSLPAEATYDEIVRGCFALMGSMLQSSGMNAKDAGVYLHEVADRIEEGLRVLGMEKHN